MRHTLNVTALVALLVVAASPIGARQTQGRVDPALFSSLKWRSIGPANTSGRIDDFAIGRVPGQPDALYVATASGGIFKSVNGGISWSSLFDTTDAMMSIGAIAVSRANPNVVWAGTGEANNRQSSSWGDGVYKSTDAGKTWKNMGLKESRHVGRIVIDPVNADIVYVAAVGHLWGSNPDRGVFKTIDGGVTWKKALFVDENTGATDLVMDPQNPKTLIAAMYQRQRKEWGFNGGGPGSGIYRSIDAGVTWRKVTKGLPDGDKGRIGLDIFRGDGKIVYAIVEAASAAGGPAAAAGQGRGAGAGGGRGGGNGASGLYRSNDNGETWELLSTQNVRPCYYSQIRVDPKDKNRIYELGSNRGFYFSDDGGKTFQDRGVSGVHGEDHALWVDPDNPLHLIVGGDGGVSISWDRGLTWDFRSNMPLGQFYEIDVDMKVPFTVCGGLQDNGEWCVPSAVRDRNGISNADAWNIGGGDGFYVKFDPTDETYAYAESQNGGMSRVNTLTHQGQSIRPQGVYRWNWDTPIIVSAADPRVIYTSANVVFRSADRGTTWTAISPDVTAQVDPATLEMMGAKVPANALSRNDGSSPYGSITSLSESPLDPRVLYSGANDGALQVTRDGGKTWTDLSTKIPGVPPRSYVSTVLASKHAAGRVFVTFDGHYADDYRPFVFVSEDYGQTWASLAAGLPETSINRLREDPASPHVLVLAHERGVHVSNDDGRTWTSLSLTTNLPPVPTDDAIIHPRDRALVLGTHGRGIWILDDVGPIAALTPLALATDAVLAPIAPAREMLLHNPQAWFGSGIFFAPNPDFDAGINYYLRDGAAGTVQIEITDMYGTKVRSLEGPGAKGLNRVRWDLRMDLPASTGAPAAPAGRAGGGRGGGRGGPLAALVAPGKYMVTLKIPGLGRELRGEVVVEADPLATVKR
jgi:photosystem II stability/assembly factor-like uncharacterized protein